MLLNAEAIRREEDAFFFCISVRSEVFSVRSDYSVTGSIVSIFQKKKNNYLTLNGDYHSQPP